MAQARGTREQLLEAAGPVFAAKGVDRATGKEICKRAGTNAAAINYHFGGMDGLYTATLVEAHHRLVSVEAMAAAAAGGRSAVAKLEAVVSLVAGALVGPLSSSWMLRVLSRELLSPTRALRVLRERELLPKARIIRTIVGELMQLPADHPAVGRASVNILAPFVFLLVGDRNTIVQAFPGLGLRPQDAATLSKHFLQYALAGVAAAARAAGQAGRRASDAPRTRSVRPRRSSLARS